MIFLLLLRQGLAGLDWFAPSFKLLARHFSADWSREVGSLRKPMCVVAVRDGLRTQVHLSPCLDRVSLSLSDVSQVGQPTSFLWFSGLHLLSPNCVLGMQGHWIRFLFRFWGPEASALPAELSVSSAWKLLIGVEAVEWGSWCAALAGLELTAVLLVYWVLGLQLWATMPGLKAILTHYFKM